jgi:hypothetical protein
VKVQCHEVVDGRVQGLKALLVLQGLGDGRDRRDQVGHDICYAVLPQAIIVRRVSSNSLLREREGVGEGRQDLLDAALSDRGHNCCRHGAISEVDMEVRSCWQLILVVKRHVYLL